MTHAKDLSQNHTFFSNKFPIRQRAIFYWSLSQLFKHDTKAVIIDTPGDIPFKFAEELGVSAFAFCEPSLNDKLGVKMSNDIKYPQSFITNDNSIGTANIDKVIRQAFCGGSGGELGGINKLQIRTVDYLFTGLKSLDWLHFKIFNDFAKHLASCQKVIQKFHPVMTLVLMHKTSESDFSEFKSLLDKLNYQLFDDSWSLVTDYTSYYETSGVDFVVVPKGYDLPIENHNFLNGSFAGSHFDLLEARELDDLTILSKPSSCVQTLTKLVHNQYISFNTEELMKSGFYPVEQYDGIDYSWSGPDKHSVLVMPVPHFGQYNLQIRLYSSQEVTRKHNAHILIGRQAAKAVSIPESGVIELDFVISSDEYQGYIEVSVLLNEVQHIPDSGRHLGLAIQDYSLYWQEKK